MSEATVRRKRREPARPSDRVLTVPEVMAELQVGRTKIYDLIKSGALRSFMVGGQRRVRRSALDAYIEKQEQPS